MTHFSQPDKPVPTDVPRCQGGGEDWLNTWSNNNNTYCNNNIVKLIDLFENSEYYYIVMEFMAGNDMFDFLQRKNFSIPEDHVKELAI